MTNPFEIEARLRKVAEVANFPLEQLRANLIAWADRDGEALALELLAAKELKLGIA